MDLFTMGIMEKMSWHTIGAVVGITSEATGYPKENLVDYNPDTYWKGSSDVDQDIQFDLGSAQSVFGCYIFLRNYSSGSWTNGVIRLLSSSTGLSSSYTERATLTLVDTGTPHRIVDIGASHSYRYWIIQIDAIVGETIPEISFSCLTVKRSITASNELPEGDSSQYQTKTTKAGGGRVFTRAINNNAVNIIPRSFKYNGTTDMTALQAAYDDTTGNLVPMVLQEGSAQSDALLVKLSSAKLIPNKQKHELYEPKVTFESLPYIDDGEVY